MVGNNRDLYDKSGIGFESDTLSDYLPSNATPSDIKFVLSGSSLSKHRSFTVFHKLDQKEKKRYPKKKRPFGRLTNPS